MKPPNQLWRSLDELSRTEAFQRAVEDEFPQGAVELERSPNRRDVLRLLGASLGLAGITACTRQPAERIVPYVRQPEELIPGQPLFFATAMPFHGGALGLLVESHEGHPTKVEGNPRHPASLGATDVYAQASILTLYDPDRSRTILRNGRISGWSPFLAAAANVRDQQTSKRGAGLRIVTPPVISPTLAAQRADLLTQFPEARWIQFDPVMTGEEQRALGGVVPRHRVDQAQVILSLDSEFLCHGPASVVQARQFAQNRRPRPGASLVRLYAIDCTATVTGSSADHRIAVRASDMPAVVAALLAGVSTPGSNASSSTRVPSRFLDALVRDLQAHRGTSLVIAGEHQPPEVHQAVRAINTALGNVGHTVDYAAPAWEGTLDPIADLHSLIDEMNRGAVDAVWFLDVNPMYDAPVDLGFEQALSKVRTRFHSGLYVDETALLTEWHIPSAHYLESWSDARAADGTVTIMQPLIEPLYGGRTLHELVAVLAGHADSSSHDLVKQHWSTRQGHAGDFETWWEQSLHDGIAAGPATSERASESPQNTSKNAQKQLETGGFEVVFRPDYKVWDGRFANNGWLQELPHPLTRLTWDNAAWMSGETARKLKIENGQTVELAYRGRTVQAPVWLVAGMPDDSITVHLGYGRRAGGSIASGTGFNAGSLRTADAPWSGSGLEIRNPSAPAHLACTQNHHAMEHRELVRIATQSEYQANPKFAHREEPSSELTLYPQWNYSGYAWGMTIDLNACVGCSACVVACQSENNIPVVGKDQVRRGREMHWLRIDRYYRGDFALPQTFFEPMLCQHCENAPCEVVCPVAATAHSSEGLNQMVYNRCVGTRYCSNNCPYKVRRFNFYLFSDWNHQSLYGMRNPDVTVRSRGVMEKCTYCVQRIQEAKIQAEKEDRFVRDGEIVTACQQSCPTEAIVFGDINNPANRVAKLRSDPRNYGVLADLNTRPRTTYLARVRNPNPELEPPGTPPPNDHQPGDRTPSIVDPREGEKS